MRRMKEKETVEVDGVPITYFLSEKAVHIDNNKELESIIPNPKTAIKLARKLKANYQKKYGRELSVSELSMAIEIYGHIYPEKMAKAKKELPLPGFVDQAMENLIEKADIIDSGEESIDQNRKIWDVIAKVIPV